MKRKRAFLHRKSSFTLLEIMICIAILGMVATAVAFPLTSLLARHRFTQGVKQFMVQMRSMQSLALNYQSDMGVMLYQDKEKWMCKGYTDEPISLFRSFELTHITSVTFNEKQVKLPLKIDCFASGRIQPAGELTFFRDNDLIVVDFKNPLQIKGGKYEIKE